MANLGVIERVDLTEVWPHEAQDFTPWLADNLDELSEALSLDLEFVEREAPVGPFFLDVLNRSQGGIYICGVQSISLCGASQFCCASPKHGPASAFDFLPSVGQMGEKSPTFSCTAALAPKHSACPVLDTGLAVPSRRTQPQTVSSALKSGL